MLSDLEFKNRQEKLSHRLNDLRGRLNESKNKIKNYRGKIKKDIYDSLKNDGRFDGDNYDKNNTELIENSKEDKINKDSMYYEDYLIREKSKATGIPYYALRAIYDDLKNEGYNLESTVIKINEKLEESEEENNKILEEKKLKQNNVHYLGSQNKPFEVNNKDIVRESKRLNLPYHLLQSLNNNKINKGIIYKDLGKLFTK